MTESQDDGKAIPPLSQEQVGAIFAAMHALDIHKNQDLADRAGVNRSYLSEILNRRAGPGMHVAPKLARALRLPISVFLPGASVGSTDPARPPVDNNDAQKAPQPLDRSDERGVTNARGEARELDWGLYVAATVAGRANGGPGEGYVNEPITVPVEVVRGRNFRAWEVAGSCMEPELSEGDIVLIDLDARPVDGKLVVARRKSGEVLLKRYFRRAGENGGPALIELRPNIDAAGVGELVILEEDQVDIVGVIFYKMRAVGRLRPGQVSWAVDSMEQPAKRAG